MVVRNRSLGAPAASLHKVYFPANAMGWATKIELAPCLRDAGKTESRHAATPIMSVFGPRLVSFALAPA